MADSLPHRQRRVVILEVFSKKTATTPKTVIAAAQRRLKEYDAVTKR